LEKIHAPRKRLKGLKTNITKRGRKTRAKRRKTVFHMENARRKSDVRRGICGQWFAGKAA